MQSDESLDRSGSSRDDGISRNVSFNSVDIREYDRTIGDHPSCSSGPPITLDWSYSKNSAKSLDEYELERLSERFESKSSLRLNKLRRKQMLSFHWGHSEDDMKMARKDTKKTQFQRKVTSKLLPVYKVYEVAQNKVFGRKQSNGYNYDDGSITDSSSTKCFSDPISNIARSA